MVWVSATSQQPVFKSAAKDVVDQLKRNLKGGRPDIALVFVSAHHAASYYMVPKLIWEQLKPKALVGSSTVGVIGDAEQGEDTPGLVVVAGKLGGAEAHAFEFQPGSIPDMDGSPRDWHARVGAPPSKVSSMLLLADPVSINTQGVLAGLDFAYSRASKCGALASGGAAPGENAIFINGDVRRSGMVGVALGDRIRQEGAIAPSCRPIGEPLVVTQSRDNVIHRLDTGTPINILASIYNNASEADKSLMVNHLTIGIATHQTVGSQSPDDMLLRNITATNRFEGSIAVGDMVHEGQIVQFHVIDGSYAKAEIDRNLREGPLSAADDPSSLALMFSCVGRGRNIFGSGNYEVQRLRGRHPKMPLAGMLCNGQISTINGTSYLMGYTSVTNFLTTLRKGRGIKSSLESLTGRSKVRRKPPA